MNRTVIAALVIWAFAAAASAQVYYWTDENGVKHFSNVKPAEEVEFGEKKEEKSSAGAAQQQPPPSQPRNAAPPEAGPIEPAAAITAIPLCRGQITGPRCRVPGR